MFCLKKYTRKEKTGNKKGTYIVFYKRLFFWCLGRESNSYRDLAPRDFKSLASTNSATQAQVFRIFRLQTAISLIIESQKKCKKE